MLCDDNNIGDVVEVYTCGMGTRVLVHKLPGIFTVVGMSGGGRDHFTGDSIVPLWDRETGKKISLPWDAKVIVHDNRGYEKIPKEILYDDHFYTREAFYDTRDM